MSFTDKSARYRRLAAEHAAWGLLRAETAPLILAFLSDLFAEESEVPLQAARAALDAKLNTWREVAGADAETPASVYLRKWMESGYIREQEQKLSMTDACQIALRFADGLSKRDLGATASHLRIVQDAVQDLVLEINPDISERINTLQERQLDLQIQIDKLKHGVIEPMSETAKRERIREVYQLASQLTGDFRHLEDEIRRMDQEMRQAMIESSEPRGMVLERLLDAEDLLADTPSGRAFEGFMRLLQDSARNTEFSEQLRALASHEVSRFLAPEEQRYLKLLTRILHRDSERVFQRRKRTSESLRAYVASGAHQENKEIERLLREIVQVAVTLHRLPNFSPRAEILIELGAGRIRVAQLSGVHVRHPAAAVEAGLPIENVSSNTLPDQMLAEMRSINPREIARRLVDPLREHGKLTLGELALYSPVRECIEEVVARTRIAYATQAIPLEGEEVVEFQERDGRKGQARIPSMLLDANQFPENLENLSI